MNEQYDVIVVGGGPAGSTTAGLLAKWGRRVLVLEKEKFPRYHIGESLVPGCMPIFEQLGVLDEIEAAASGMKKYGITFLWGANPKPWQMEFAEVCPHPYSFEVKRAEFDNILLNNSRRLGATVIEEATVREPVFEEGRCIGVRYVRAHSDELIEVRAPMVVDASGQAKFLGHRLGAVDWHDDLKNLAVWSYFQGGTRHPGRFAGNITVENRPTGWLWMIPFGDDSCSVGFVGPVEEFTGAGKPPAEILKEQIAVSTQVKELLATATEIEGSRTAKDWSYSCEQMTAPGALLVGDAAAFVDPLFSTGVMLGMKGATAAARSIHAILDEPEREAEFAASYEQAYREFLGTVVTFVRFFYDATRKVGEYFEEAQNLVDPKHNQAARKDFVGLISGLYGSRDIMNPIAPLPDESQPV